MILLLIFPESSPVSFSKKPLSTSLDSGAMVRTLSPPEAEEFVKHLLRSKGQMTTKEIETAARGEGKRCPDETVLFLTKLRSKGIIQGQISQEKRGWVWWI
jgi:hypothetical protein